mgnify:FL=1|tara:strand:- start:188 stop:625 length:438 start_codon:yes stop_codon:yes gene_type:complete
MKKALTLLVVLLLTANAFAQETINVNVKKEKSYNEKENEQTELLAAKSLVHLVLIKFKKDILPNDFQKITDGAYGLQQIEGVLDLNFGENVSPEGLGQGFSHSLTMKFPTAKDRDSIYLPHPVHQKFVKLFVPFTTDVLVYDYWE